MNRLIWRTSATVLLALFFGGLSAAAATQPVEVTCGVVFSVSAPSVYSGWISAFRSKFQGTEWNRMLHLHSSPYVVLKNTSNRPIILASNPTVIFTQPPVNFKFTRIAQTMAGSITSQRVAADQMYVNSANRSLKSFSMTLYGQVVNGVGTGNLSIPAGQTRILTPDFNQTTTLANRLDWQNLLTVSLNASPGWQGCANGFTVDWLSGGAATSFNGDLGVIATRSTDFWEVECGFSGTQGTWRVFKLLPDRSPVVAPNLNQEITNFPFNLSGIESTVSTASMAVNMNQPAYLQPVSGMFSVLGTPNSASTLAVLSDSDLNSLPDEWEFQFFNQLGVSPTADADGDGLSNYFEYVSGHSPVNANDKFVQKIDKLVTGNLTLTWSSFSGRDYVIERSIDLSAWTPFATVPAAASPAVSTTFDLGPPSSSATYFRFRLTAPP